MYTSKHNMSVNLFLGTNYAGPRIFLLSSRVFNILENQSSIF